MKGYSRRWEFSDQHTVEERKGLARRMKRHQPGNVPVVLGRAAQCRVGTYQELRVSAPGHMSLAQLHLALRTRIEVNPRHSIIFFIGNTLAPVTCTLASLYHNHANTDHFLYVTFCEENFQG
ncbi:hypothetical protein O3P69_006333 [Scylla paramamosain]|uniref:Autophagy-related protein n=2 Tax=Scylla TaxID=6760 RepID=A0A0P4WFQ9_SCYOL